VVAAAHPGDPRHEPHVAGALGQGGAQGPGDAGGHVGGHRQPLDPAPEGPGRVPSEAQVVGPACQQNRVAARGQRARVTLQQRPRRHGGRDGEAFGAHRQQRAGQQAHEIGGPREGVDLVQVVDAPCEAPFRIAPGAEVLDVDVTDREHRHGVGERAGVGGPALDPAEVGAPEEREGVLRHPPVPARPARTRHGGAGVDPLLVGTRRGEHVGERHPMIVPRSTGL